MIDEQLQAVITPENNCLDKFGKIIPATHIIAIDDDVISALWAVYCYYLIREQHHYCPTVVCVGGKGLLSKHTRHKSEAELLASVAHQCGVPSEKIVCLPEGTNTGDNVQAVKAYAQAGNVFIWAVTQRLSLRLQLTVQQQAAELKSHYMVIKQTLYEVQRFYNGKGLCRGQMLKHELASILDRCERYAGTYQAPIPFEISPEVRAAANLLKKKYRLKLPHKNFRSVCQFLRLFIALKVNKSSMRVDLEILVSEFIRNELLAQKLVNRAELPDSHLA